MKKLMLVLGMGLALLAAPALTACSSLADAATSVAVSASSTSNLQQHSLAAAENAYSLAGQAVLTYNGVKPLSAATKAQIKAYDAAVYAELVKAREANAKGDSPAVAVALDAMKPLLGKLTNYLTGLGVSVPTLPAF